MVSMRIEGRPIHEPLFDQERFERLDSQGEVGRDRLRVVVNLADTLGLSRTRGRGCPCGRDRSLQKTASGAIHQMVRDPPQKPASETAIRKGD